MNNCNYLAYTPDEDYNGARGLAAANAIDQQRARKKLPMKKVEKDTSKKFSQIFSDQFIPEERIYTLERIQKECEGSVEKEKILTNLLNLMHSLE